MSGIKIDGQSYSVKLTTEPIGGADGERSFLGQSDEGSNTIVIDGTMPATRQEEVLFHEMIHMAVSGLPEGLVRDLSVRVYGALRESGLLVEDIVSLVSDGNVTPDEMARLNKAAKELAEEPMKSDFFRVSEQSWDGPVFTETGGLLVNDSDGAVNRTAVHQAAAQFAGAHGGVRLRASERRSAARALVALYRDILKEPIPSVIQWCLDR